MTNEEWKWVKEYEWYYYVSNHGRIKIRKTNKILKLATDKDGYIKCHLYKRGVRKSFRVHRLVAETFLDKPEGCTEVDHIDNNRANNHATNLRWCTHDENIAKIYGDYSEDINVVEAETMQIIAMCRSINEASQITKISHKKITKIIGTNESYKGYRFENGF
jgi:hypothetical protein